MSALAGKTMFISGASRGIGLAIAKRVAQDGANVALVAKTTEPHPKLPGTIYTAAEEIEAAGGQALPIVGDIREEDSVASAVAQTIEKFGGIDICVNNASAINLSGTEALEMKRYDLMHDINARGTFLFTKCALPHLRKAENAHVLTLAPPVKQITEAKWFKDFPAYAAAKFGMSLYTMGHAEEFRSAGIAFNALWPRTVIATAAIQNIAGGPEAMKRARTPEIMADAAYEIFTRDARECTGQFFVDDELVGGDLSRYLADPEGTEADLMQDFFV